MFSREKFLKKQKVLRLATIDKKGNPHLVPVWYKYSAKKFYIGTSSKSQKARNVKVNKTVCFCVDDGIWHPIYGVMGVGKAKLILRKSKVKRVASSILLRYFKSLNLKSAKELLEQTDCIIEITPKKITSWQY
ncbi:pyridoxamine 5'-phosphate oxidase family protein [Candidatus Nitrosotenuis uzonensis]|uniref:Pyridoxamine 5'-phosphate oxidase-related FMN-binding n=1 Tax=Candidatus Nitrosotenuis uzonensis TaxID=1407055 RepID=V6AVC7_9ARCH|nr:pyridoxamine 5'-phosphate oxidase family protein [Candidatus Nitrosotenuis uzonensis]CDI06448.1 Pyridoxamine 5'-phosphate oxidase-related FMN-binding [Candidatus Nitrosotenuis uzonensis]